MAAICLRNPDNSTALFKANIPQIIVDIMKQHANEKLVQVRRFPIVEKFVVNATVSIHFIFAENGELGDKEHGVPQQIPVPDLPEFGRGGSASEEPEEIQGHRIRHESGPARPGLPRSAQRGVDGKGRSAQYWSC